MSKELKAYAPLHRVTVISNGVPLSLFAEVEITIKRPSKLDPFSERAWSQVTPQSLDGLTVELVPGVKG